MNAYIYGMEQRIKAYFGGDDPAAAAEFFGSHEPGYTCMDMISASNLLKPRPADAHKGTFGHALLIAGSAEKTGAAILAAAAALRSGCGLLTAMVPDECRVPLLAVVPEAMVIKREDNGNNLPLLQLYQAVGFGPGVGDHAGPLLEALLNTAAVPMVIDADGLNLLSKHRNWYHYLSGGHVLTPHPKEFDRLTQTHSSILQRIKTQVSFAREYGITLLLKGRFTTVCGSDGHIYINTSGNSGMATAGSGDVLTGIILSLLAQGYEPLQAAVLGAYVHGFAGDAAAKIHSKTSLIASDIITQLGPFFIAYEREA